MYPGSYVLNINILFMKYYAFLFILLFVKVTQKEINLQTCQFLQV